MKYKKINAYTQKMNGNEELIISDEFIRIKGEPDTSAVMHISELSVMEKYAEIVTRNGGNILEVGFGMGLSANAIQSNPNVKSHTIIEIHPHIYQRAIEWSKDKPNTEIILGNWVDILPNLNKKFDGIFHDTYNDLNIPTFLNLVKKNCNKNCIVSLFTYFGEFKNWNYEYIKSDKETFKKLPYYNRLSDPSFRSDNYVIRYTTFDGENFVSKNKTKRII